MKKVKCLTLDGSYVYKDVDSVIERDCAYGLIRNEGDILFVRSKSTGRYWLPGGGIDDGETPIEALKREIWEECGIDVIVGDMVFSKEHYFYYEPFDETYFCKSIFYECTPKNLEISNNFMPNPDEKETKDPEWVPVESLTMDDIQFGMEDVAEKFILNG